jgi:dTMP kinase
MTKFITFEGGEGSGKTTMLAMMAERLRGDGLTVKTCHDPGSTNIAINLRPLLLDKQYNICREAELLLYLAARAELVDKVIKPTMERGQVDFIICDRFYDSTAVYQGVIRGWDEIRAWREEAPRSETTFLEVMHLIFSGNIHPDYTFLFDVDPVLGLKRSKGIEIGEGRWELEGVEVHKNINMAFLDLAEMNDDRIIIVDADQGKEDVFTDLLGIFMEEGLI